MRGHACMRSPFIRPFRGSEVLWYNSHREERARGVWDPEFNPTNTQTACPYRQSPPLCAWAQRTEHQR
jgi:hypothetical protein